MKQYVIFFIVILFSFSFSFSFCSSKKEKVIDFKLIPEKTMSCILYDLHMNDGIINAYNNQDKSNIFLSQEHYNKQIFKKYNCTDTLFKMNVQHYSMNGKIKDIYSQVIDSMNTLKSTLDQKRQKRIHATVRNRNEADL